MQNDMLKEEKELVAEQRKLVAEERAILGEEKKTLRALRVDAALVAVGLLAVAAVGAAAFMNVRAGGGRVVSDKAQIAGTVIDLAPQTAGTLDETYVRPGDVVEANAPVVRVGGELVKAKVAGEVLSVHDDIGTRFTPGQSVATMLDRSSLRVEVRIEEDKGLKDIAPGQPATFTVDAFSGKTYVGTVDEVSPTSRASGAVFSISDKRETKEFNVRIRFDARAYAEIKNGMSAKVVIFTR
ncbi:MAG TPA: HlyD family efflux transporter periplasmic adaptor subunit [Candidatus Binatia bacterium]|jgi:multidrug resistance efflux pump|nr:HlyD family efflux transporter periplasmic adaptor subunit [Candidatus Binatia bacterium]